MNIHKSINNLIEIDENLKLKVLHSKKPKIIAVSKTFPIEDIKPLINHGHLDFGENKVQEAVFKWTDIKLNFNYIKLHMIGKLQTNKVKYVIPIFDYIHTLDNIRLAEKIANEQIKKDKRLKIFVQVNIGHEDQKNGIEVKNLTNFYNKCITEYQLDIVGLMCIPPISPNPKAFFLKMKELSDSIHIPELSMGMSEDYIEAAINGSTYLRIGSKIFGKRD